MKTQTFKAPPVKGSQIQTYLLSSLNMRGWLAVRINGICRTIGKYFVQSYIIEANKKSVGFPDVVAFRGDGNQTRALLIEVKTANEPLTDSQITFQKLAKRFGVKVRIVRSIADVDNLLAEVAA